MTNLHRELTSTNDKNQLRMVDHNHLQINYTSIKFFFISKPFPSNALKFLQTTHDSTPAPHCSAGDVPGSRDSYRTGNGQWANHQCLQDLVLKNRRRPAEGLVEAALGPRARAPKKSKKTSLFNYCQSDGFTLFLGPYHYNDPLSHRRTSHHHPTSPSFGTLYGPQN